MPAPARGRKEAASAVSLPSPKFLARGLSDYHFCRQLVSANRSASFASRKKSTIGKEPKRVHLIKDVTVLDTRGSARASSNANASNWVIGKLLASKDLLHWVGAE